MAVKSVYIENNLAANTYRGPSASIWGANGTPNAWIAALLEAPSLGVHVFDDFQSTGPVASTAAAAVTQEYRGLSLYAGKTGTIVDASIQGGGITLVPGTSTTNEPMTLMSQNGCFQLSSASTQAGTMGRLAFECRVALLSVLASMRDAFVGLADPQGAPNIAIPITAGTGTNQLCTSNNLIGFYAAYSGGAAGDWQFVYQKASTAPVFVANLGSLISTVTGSAIQSGTYYKLGFDYNPLAPVQAVGVAGTGQTVGQQAQAVINIYVNGLKAATFLTKGANIFNASFPTGVMGPCFGICNEVSSVNASTNAGNMSLDWYRVAQLNQT